MGSLVGEEYDCLGAALAAKWEMDPTNTPALAAWTARGIYKYFSEHCCFKNELCGHKELDKDTEFVYCITDVGARPLSREGCESCSGTPYCALLEINPEPKFVACVKDGQAMLPMSKDECEMQGGDITEEYGCFDVNWGLTHDKYTNVTEKEWVRNFFPEKCCSWRTPDNLEGNDGTRPAQLSAWEVMLFVSFYLV